MFNRKGYAILVVILAICVGSVQPATFKGVEMADTMKLDSDTLVLNGMALRKKLIFKVYVAGLYLPKKETDEKKILGADTKRGAIMHFVRGVGANKINGGWQDGLKDNTPNHTIDLKKKFDTLCSYMEKVEDGERVEFYYIPNVGTKIIVKKKEKGIIQGKDFADALFACWIGPKPGPGKGFKADLLGK